VSLLLILLLHYLPLVTSADEYWSIQVECILLGLPMPRLRFLLPLFFQYHGQSSYSVDCRNNTNNTVIREVPCAIGPYFVIVVSGDYWRTTEVHYIIQYVYSTTFHVQLETQTRPGHPMHST
jgi:hypothetical protein